MRKTEQFKAALLPQYRILLQELSASAKATFGRAEDYVRVLNALRDPHSLAEIEPAHGQDQSLIRTVTSPLAIMAAYLERLPGTSILFLEAGPRSPTFLLVRGGADPAEERCVLTNASADLASAMGEVIRQHAYDLERIREGASPDEMDAGRLIHLLEDAWQLFPADIRRALAECRSIIYSPGSEGGADRFPFELLRSPNGWLGATHTIVRHPTLQTISRVLSPNSLPSTLGARVLIVSAEEVTGPDHLKSAAAEVERVRRWTSELGLESKVMVAPDRTGLREALDEGYAIMHYIGHGVAGDLAEALPLRTDERFLPQDLSQLSGWRSPFVYLSACEVGRSRATVGGGQSGMALRFVEKGSPAVVACLAEVPDIVAPEVAEAFYAHAADHTISEALTLARADLALAHVHPACWGPYAAFGDPNYRLAHAGLPAGAPVRTADLTRTWRAGVGRVMAIRSLPEVEQCKAELADALLEVSPDQRVQLGAVLKWVGTAFEQQDRSTYEARLELCRSLAGNDVLAAGALRTLLSLESADGAYGGALDSETLVLEIHQGMRCAAAGHDGLAWVALAGVYAKVGFGAFPISETLKVLEEAEGILAAWSPVEPGVTGLHDSVKSVLELLKNTHVFDIT